MAPPASVPAGVLLRWQPATLSLRLGIAAAALLTGLGLATVALFVASAPALATSLIAWPASLLALVATPLAVLLAVPAKLFFDYPAVLAAYVGLTAALCTAWVRLYQQVQVPRRIPS